jgi:hypothetical protein
MIWMVGPLKDANWNRGLGGGPLSGHGHVHPAGQGAGSEESAILFTKLFSSSGLKQPVRLQTNHILRNLIRVFRQAAPTYRG